MTADLAARVGEILEVDADAFEAQARADAEVVKEGLRDGAFDNHQSIVGLEYEFYAVADGRWNAEADQFGRLTRVPRRLLELIGFEKELGLHNAEMTTSPQPFSAHGLQAQMSEVRARLEAALDCAAAEGMRLVSDAMWTIPPAGETARGYLTDHVEVDEIRLATNMSDAVRYHAMANGPNAPEVMELSAPHVSLPARTVLPESLITSIQPHFQVAHAADLPEYFRYALRVAGPLLALGVNSPFFPPDLYDEAATPEAILADGFAENRIAVFESVLNTDDAEKVRFPRDFDTVEEAVDRVATDPSVVPMPVTRGDRFDDSFATLRRKHGTFWRWVRPVFDGATRSAANARIEFRPIAAQPTVRDSIAFQATFAGLMESLPQRAHPVVDMPWETAKANFEAATREGLDASMEWVTNAGATTTNTEELYADLFAHAVDGLEAAGCSTETAEYYVEPLRARVESGTTPAAWKRREVRRRLEDGEELEHAVYEMQRLYVETQKGTLLSGCFTDWLG